MIASLSIITSLFDHSFDVKKTRLRLDVGAILLSLFSASLDQTSNAVL